MVSGRHPPVKASRSGWWTLTRRVVIVGNNVSRTRGVQNTMLKTVPDLVAEARTHLRCVDATTAMQEIRANGGTIVDVREPVEVSNLAAPRSVHIPRGILEMKIGEVVPDAGHPLYLHCATGGRATLAAEQLVKMGYENVSVVTCPADTVCEVQAAFVD